MRQPELIPASPESAVPTIVVLEPEPPIAEDGPIDIPEVGAEPVALAPADIPAADAKDNDEDGEELDPEEPEQLDEDEILDAVVPAPAPAPAQPDNVDIGADELAEAMIQAQALATDDEVADDEIDEVGDDDEDLEDMDDLMD